MIAFVLRKLEEDFSVSTSVNDEEEGEIRNEAIKQKLTTILN
jgi:hypothetical protein